MDHQHRIVEQFTAQVDRFVNAPHVNQEGLVRQFLSVVAPSSDERVLDVACGPGLLARALLPHAREVVGVDLTPAMVEKAREVAPAARFEVADAARLPFADGEFDLAVSRLALHHMPEPLAVVREMARVARRVGLFDLVSSEVPEEEAYHNRVEVLRDPTHTRGLSCSELVRTVGLAGLDLVRLEAAEMELEAREWMARADQSHEEAEEAHRMIADAVGTRMLGGRTVRRDQDGRLWFAARYAVLVAVRRE